MRRIALLTCCLFLSGPALSAPQVTTSILPLYSLVANVMAGVGSPVLLLNGQNSEHTAVLTPEQLEQLNHSDVVFIIGAGLEYKLSELSGSEAVGSQKFISLSAVPGVKLLSLRQGGSFEAHDHEHEGEEALASEHSAEASPYPKYNAHIWLDPENAKAMVSAIAADLSQADPANAPRYQANALAYQARLDGLSREIAEQTAALQKQPYIVFHDAYPYYEARFGLNDVGSISDASAASPSAQRLSDIRAKLKNSKAVCVFREPQYDQKFVRVVTEGSDVKTGVLDPIGYDLTPGPLAYEEMMRNLTHGLVACLKP